MEIMKIMKNGNNENSGNNEKNWIRFIGKKNCEKL